MPNPAPVLSAQGLGKRFGDRVIAADVLGWRMVAPLFDRERLITGR